MTDAIVSTFGRGILFFYAAKSLIVEVGRGLVKLS